MMENPEPPKETADCGIPNQCSRSVPLWLVLLDNIPTLVMFFLGIIVVGHLSLPLGALFLVYCALSIVLFWRLICPYCHHFGTRACPCGYGAVAPLFFRQRSGRELRSVFRKNIGVVFPCWFVPLGIGAWLLYVDYSATLLWLFVSFCTIGFVAIPAIAILVGCKSCDLKDECPWMSVKGSGRQ